MHTWTPLLKGVSTELHSYKKKNTSNTNAHACPAGRHLFAVEEYFVDAFQLW